MSLESDEILDAVKQLSQSRVGRNAMRRLLVWLDDDGISLDRRNQNAISVILRGAWGRYAGTSRDLMREALADYGRQGQRIEG